ncbi:TIGR00659 family protein [Clostridium cavendishii DSM 21758]|uniref:TIGR00659 family protein n=1 Tax=Clostridium cavendishii DSM 21758 TaxID=1121302 RepID=A0A1M6NQS2_9CLOT|nr:LrgB family protein [Clostridium cavendishii]SHJ98008.1 TIGR00659 family protein [Clostridium cavendishii DSM 21758]
MNSLLDNALFGITLSLLAFEVGAFIYRKTKISFFNPLLIAITLVILVLVIFNINFDTYNKGGQFITIFLGPATVILAVPLYKQISLLKKHAFPILVGIFVGSTVGIISIILLSHVFNLQEALVRSLAPKSVTTPIGMEIAKNMQGIVPVTVISIVVSGIIGSIVGPGVCKVLKIKSKIAVGISLGTAAHAVGTTRALELGETEGAMSSLSIGIAGLMTVFLAPIIYNLINKLM